MWFSEKDRLVGMVRGNLGRCMDDDKGLSIVLRVMDGAKATLCRRGVGKNIFNAEYLVFGFQ